MRGCTVVQVRKGKYPHSVSSDAIAKGEAATSMPKQELFRTNTAKQKRLFPEHNAYTNSGCKGCSQLGEFTLAYKANNEMCQACEVLRRNRKGVEESRAKFNSYPEKEWEKRYFDELTGGYTVVHKFHQFAKTQGGGKAELVVGELLAKAGRQVEFLAENAFKLKKPDISFDGKTWDIKSIANANENTIRSYIKEASKKADRVLFYFEDDATKSLLHNAVNRHVGYLNKENKIEKMPEIYFINELSGLVSVWVKK